jgi:glycosyltransferase involved in cell wall biosynthesis
MCQECPQVKEYPASLYFDFTKIMHKEKKKIFAGFDNLTIVTPSHWLKNRVKKSFIKDIDIRVINNGIDTKDIFYPRNFQHLKKKHNLIDEKIILSVAPNIMDDRKGGTWVLEIARQLRSENVIFILIGIDNLKERFDDNIIALGRTANQKELAEYYSMADVTLITSQKETFSLVCAESLACGTPIVGFESGAPSEIAPEGYGTFVEYGNVELLLKILNNIIKSNFNIKLKTECESFSIKNYSKILMAERYLKLYNE